MIELAQRKAAHLFKQLKTTNDKFHLVRRLPNERQVEAWIFQAKKLPRVISYH